ncbi:hypothetical protein MTO96_026336 [Rhipicephalus appendiculatus]
MVVAKFLVAVAGLVVSVSGFAYNTDSTNSIDCDFTGMDLDAAISRMLAKIPAYEEKVGDTYRHTLAGIAFVGINMTGMNKLIRYGPAIRYCVNGTRMVQIDLVNDGDVKISVPWKSCEGSTGTIYLTADFSRFTTQLRVKENGFGEVSFSNEGPVYPVSTEEIKLRNHWCWNAHDDGGELPLPDFTRFSQGTMERSVFLLRQHLNRQGYSLKLFYTFWGQLLL